MTNLDRHIHEEVMGQWPLPCGGVWRWDDWREGCCLPLGHETPWCQNVTGSIRWKVGPDPRQGRLFVEEG